MKLVEDLRNRKAQYLIISGDGRTELKILKSLSEKYNGKDLILFFPFPSRSKKTGLNALNVLKTYFNLSINFIIFIVDGDAFEGNPADIKIKEHLNSIGIQILNIILIQDAFLIHCKSGNNIISLYCIISWAADFY